MHHSFDINIANKYGVNVAIFLNNMAFWIQKNIANNKHFHDGNYWTYNTVEAYTQLFPYWTTRQVRNVIDKCIKLGLILESNYNITTYDRTKWYALTEHAAQLLNITICQKGQMDSSKVTNGFDRNDKPIPDIKPVFKPDNNNAHKKKNNNFEKDKSPQYEVHECYSDVSSQSTSFIGFDQMLERDSKMRKKYDL